MDRINSLLESLSLKRKPPAIPFLQLPTLIQYNLLEKFTYQDAVKFEWCSEASKAVIDGCKHKFVYTAFALKYLNGSHQVFHTAEAAYGLDPKTQVDYDFNGTHAARLVLNRIILSCTLTQQKCARIVEELRRAHVQASILSYYPSARQNFRPEDFDNIIETCGATTIHCSKGIDVMYLTSNAVRRLNRLVIFDCLQFHDEVLLNFHSREIEIKDSPITGSALNTLFRHWRRGERELFFFRTFSAIENFDDILTDLPAKLEWTRKKSGKIGHVSHALWKRPKEIYTLQRDMDKEVLYIAVRDDCVKVILKSKLKKNKELCFNMLELMN